MDILLQQLINGLTLGSLYAIVALGYTMVYGIIQLINFAHGEVVMFGAMVALATVITLLAGQALPPLALPSQAGCWRPCRPACCWATSSYGLLTVPCAVRRAWRR